MLDSYPQEYQPRTVVEVEVPEEVEGSEPEVTHRHFGVALWCVQELALIQAAPGR